MINAIKTALICGGDGQFSRALLGNSPESIDCHNFSRAQLDICDDASIRQVLDKLRPDIVLNGAAYNLVDAAQGDGLEMNWRLNAIAPSLLARACVEREVPLVHFSTDFVFDGAKDSPYEETDCSRPLSFYGSAKLAGENAVLCASPRHFAIRVSRLFGPVVSDRAGGKPAGNFPLLMLKLGRGRDALRVVNDQVGSPTYTPDLACATWELVQNAEGGLFHLSNAGETDFADYARTVLQMANVDCRVDGVSSEEYGAPAKRPKYSTMSNAKATARGVTPLRDWREALGEWMREVL